MPDLLGGGDDGQWSPGAEDDDQAGELAHEYDGDYCEHDCGMEGCYEDGDNRCRHEHCFNCGGCRCPGYCDDYQTYNLRPAETGGSDG